MDKKRIAFIQRIFGLIIFACSLIIFLCSTSYAKDMVNIDLVGAWSNRGAINCVKVYQDNNYNRYAYCGSENGLLIIDVTYPNIPKEITFLGIGDVNDIVFYHSNNGAFNYAVLAAWEKGIIFLDISDPKRPTYASQFDTKGGAIGVAISDNYAFVANGSSLVIIDCSDPSEPIFAGRFDTNGDAHGVAVSGNYAFVANGDNGVLVFNVTSTLRQQGNLILCPSGPSSDKNSIWAPSQNLADMTYFTFLKKFNYQYLIYYLTPDPSHDIDGDCTYDPLVVDDLTPTKEGFHNTLTDWAYNQLNTGPLYLYLTGKGTENTYQISPPNHILKASGLTILFEDQFTDNRNNWDEDDNDILMLKLKDGKYILKRKIQAGYISCQNIHLTKEVDFKIETDIKKIGGSHNIPYGIYWGNEDVAYNFGICGYGAYFLIKQVNDKRITIIDWTESAYINKYNSTNKLSVLNTGNKLQLFINDYLIKEILYEKSSIDEIGFGIGGETTIEIDNIIVKSSKNLKHYTSLAPS